MISNFSNFKFPYTSIFLDISFFNIFPIGSVATLFQIICHNKISTLTKTNNSNTNYKNTFQFCFHWRWVPRLPVESRAN